MRSLFINTLFLMAILSLLNACSKDEAQETLEDIAGTWNIDEIIYEDVSGQDSIVSENLGTLVLESCEQNDFDASVNFGCDGTYNPTDREPLAIRYGVTGKDDSFKVNISDTESLQNELHYSLQAVWDIVTKTDNQLILEGGGLKMRKITLSK